jgi:Holliday junction resolvase-like predicted endonuclease
MNTNKSNAPQSAITFESIQIMYRAAQRQDIFEKQYAEYIAETNDIYNNEYLTEEYFYNALSASLRFGKVKYNSISKNINRKQGKLEDEYDIVMFNGSSVAIIETKYRAHQNTLKHLTTKKVQNFRTLYPELATHKIYLGIASMSFNDAVINEAKELGIGILKQKGDTIECDAENIKAY